MSSGTSAFGGTAHCYRFWLGFTECRAHAANPNMCLLERADYLECLHRDKLKRRIATKAVELQRQQSPHKEAAHEGHH